MRRRMMMLLTVVVTALVMMGGPFPSRTWAEDGGQDAILSSDEEITGGGVVQTETPTVSPPATTETTGNADATAPAVADTSSTGTPSGTAGLTADSIGASIEKFLNSLKTLLDMIAQLLGLTGTGTTTGTGTSTGIGSTGSSPTPGTYTVVQGDSLWTIAERFLGSGSRYTELVEANKDKYPSLLKNPNLIYPGWVLTIPGGGSTGTTSSGTGTTTSGTSTGTTGGGSGSTGTDSGGTGGVAGLPPLERPDGRAGIERVFGSRGTNQTTVSMAAGPGGRMVSVTCHRLIAARLKAVFDEIKSRGLSQHIKTFDGCYNNRNKRGGSTPSTHAWGIAVDLNASENPMGSSQMTDGQRQLAEVFRKYGFYQLPNDPMHFQYCTGY